MNLAKLSDDKIVGCLKEGTESMNDLLNEAASRGLKVEADITTVRPTSMSQLVYADYHEITIKVFKAL